MSDLKMKPHTQKFFTEYKKLLKKFLEAWRSAADSKRFRWSPPGVQNGMLAEFVGEAIELGSMVLVDPEERGDVEFLMNWMRARKVGRAWLEENKLCYEAKFGGIVSLRVKM